MADLPVMAHRAWGDAGPPLILIHGIGGVSRLWQPIARRLAGRYRVLAVDLRGHGRSAAITGGLALADFTADLARFIEHHHLGPVTLVAHSFGACIALNFAALYPEQVRCVAAIEAVIYPPGWRTGPRPDLVARAHKRVNVWPNRAAMRAFLAARPVHARWRPELLDIYVREAAVDRPDGQVEAHFPPALEARFIETTYLEERYIVPWPHFAQIRCPTLVLRAGESAWLREETLVAVGRTIPDVETGSLPDTSHFVILEQPDLVAERVLEWLDRRCPA